MEILATIKTLISQKYTNRVKRQNFSGMAREFSSLFLSSRIMRPQVYKVRPNFINWHVLSICVQLLFRSFVTVARNTVCFFFAAFFSVAQNAGDVDKRRKRIRSSGYIRKVVRKWGEILSVGESWRVTLVRVYSSTNFLPFCFLRLLFVLYESLLILVEIFLTLLDASEKIVRGGVSFWV